MTSGARFAKWGAVAAGAAIALMVAASVVVAQGPGRELRRGGPGGLAGPGFGFGGPGLGVPLGGLDLTDAQRDQIRAVIDKQRESMAALRERMQPLHEALEQAMTVSPVDEAAIRARFADLAAAQADRAVAAAHVRLEILQLLTDEQRARLAEREQTRRQRGAQRGAARGPRAQV